MIKKRILPLVLAVVLLLCVLPPALAADGPKLSLSSGSVSPGESVTLTVSVADNPGMATCMLYFYYDTDAFAVDPTADIQLEGRYQSGGLLCVSIEESKAAGRYDGKAGMDGVGALWFNSRGENTSSNGTMMTVTFRAAVDAKPGNYSVGVGYSSRDTLNAKMEKVVPMTSDGTVTVTGSGVAPSEPETPEAPEAPVFTDVSGTWAEDYILRATQTGLIIGDGNGKYRPADKMTRAEFVMILWRAQGSPKPKGKASFTDIPDAWYQEPIAWAEENGIVNGMGNGKFAPRGNVTRQQVVTILHRLCGTPKGMEVFFASTYDALFTDSKKIHDWAKDAVYWSLYKEIYSGVGAPDPGKTLEPLADADRSQIAVMMVRYLDKY